ncbi:MAG TPA: hypothetical protein VFZ58_00635 [Candidatus Saccharimonadales bacterium]
MNTRQKLYKLAFHGVVALITDEAYRARMEAEEAYSSTHAYPRDLWLQVAGGTLTFVDPIDYECRSGPAFYSGTFDMLEPLKVYHDILPLPKEYCSWFMVPFAPVGDYEEDIRCLKMGYGPQADKVTALLRPVDQSQP